MASKAHQWPSWALAILASSAMASTSCSDSDALKDAGQDADIIDGGHHHPDAESQDGGRDAESASDADASHQDGGVGDAEAGLDASNGMDAELMPQCVPDQVDHVVRFDQNNISAAMPMDYLGRRIGFTTYRALLPEDTNQDYDGYVKDRVTGALVVTGVQPGGAAPGRTALANFSGNGHSAVLGSFAALEPSDTNLDSDIYVQDDTRATITWLSRFAQPRPMGGRTATDSAMSLVLFDAPVPNDPQGSYRTLVYSRPSDSLEIVNLDDQGQPSDRSAVGQDMTPDGRYVIFLSDSQRLWGSPHGEGEDQVYIRDRVLGTTELVCTSSIGEKCDRPSGGPYANISDDGRYVAFRSGATNLLPGEPANGLSALFIKDLWTQQIRVEHPPGTTPELSSTGDFALSPDGRHIVVEGIGLPDPSACAYGSRFYYVRNLITQQAWPLACPTRDLGFLLPNTPTFGTLSWSGDSNFIGFISDAEVTPGTLDDYWDGFVFHYCPTRRR